MRCCENNAFITQEIEQFLCEFQGVKIVVSNGARTTPPVRVHIPYMMQTVNILGDRAAFAKLSQRHQDRLLRVKYARDHAPEAVRTFFQQKFYDADGKELWVACGRGNLEAIKTVLQAAVSQGLVPAGDGRLYPDSYDLRQWLKTYGIGVDCSAFVQHTLSRVVQRGREVAGTISNEDDPYQVGWMLSRPVYCNITGESDNDDRFSLVATPGEARPGDIQVKLGHVRIVTRVEHLDGGGVMLHLAESTASKGIPVGLNTVETDIGPRRLRVQYPQPDLPIGEQVPLRLRYGDNVFTKDEKECTYVLGRLKVLTQLSQEAYDG